MLISNEAKLTDNNDEARREILEDYLGTALVALSGKEYLKVRKASSKMIKQADLSQFDVNQVSAMRSDVKKELKAFGLTEKMSYYSDGGVPVSKYEDTKTWGKRILAFSAAAVVAGLTKQPEVIMGAAAFIFAKPVVSELGSFVNTVKAKSFEEYAELQSKSTVNTLNYSELKHAHLLLRKLEHALIKKECREMTQEAYRKGIVLPPPRYLKSR